MGALFSNRCEIALQATLYISSLPKGEKVSVKEISEKISIPREFTSKVMQDLVKASILDSKKGHKGGFFLKNGSENTYLIDIVKAIDGTKIFEECLLGFIGCTQNTPCPLHCNWKHVREDIIELLSNQSLEDMADKTEVKLASIIEENVKWDVPSS